MLNSFAVCWKSVSEAVENIMGWRNRVMSNSLEKLRKENNSNDKLLTKENDRIMTDMVVYLRSSKLCDYDIEIIRRAFWNDLRGTD